MADLGNNTLYNKNKTTTAENENGNADLMQDHAGTFFESLDGLDEVGGFLEGYTDTDWKHLDDVFQDESLANPSDESNIPGVVPADPIAENEPEPSPTKAVEEVIQFPEPEVHQFPAYNEQHAFQDFGLQNLDPRLMGQASNGMMYPNAVGAFAPFPQMAMAPQAMPSGYPSYYQTPYPTSFLQHHQALPQAVHSRKRPANQVSEGEDTAREDKRRRYSTVSSEEESPRQLLGYKKPTSVPHSWGSRGQFKYSQEGELKAPNNHRDAMSLEDMQEFFFSSPAHRTKPITLYVGRQPFGTNARFSSQPIYRGCRFAGCLEKSGKGCSGGGTVEKGNYVIMADEFGGTVDPFRLPRWHLWCVERYMDFPRMISELDVRMESRQTFAKGARMDKEAAGMSLVGRASSSGSAGNAQYECGTAFLKHVRNMGMCPPVSRKNTETLDIDGGTEKADAMQAVFGDYPHHQNRGHPQFGIFLEHWNEDPAHGPYFGTLGSRMAMIKVNKDGALARHEANRIRASLAPSRFVSHLYDLAKSCPGRRSTRRLSQQLSHKTKGRKTMQDLEQEQEVMDPVPKRLRGRTVKRQKVSDDDDDEYDPSYPAGYRPY